MNSYSTKGTIDWNLIHQHIWNLIQNQSEEFKSTDTWNLIQWNLIQATTSEFNPSEFRNSRNLILSNLNFTEFNPSEFEIHGI